MKGKEKGLANGIDAQKSLEKDRGMVPKKQSVLQI